MQLSITSGFDVLGGPTEDLLWSMLLRLYFVHNQFRQAIDSVGDLAVAFLSL